MMPEHRWLWRGTVDRVVDGDTVDVDIDTGFRVWRLRERVRIVGPDGLPFDAPEMRGRGSSQAGADAALALAGMLPHGASVQLETFRPDGRDAFGRWLACLWVRDEPAEQDVATRMVEAGHGQWEPDRWR